MSETLMSMTRQQINLLLHLETRCVDHLGIINDALMNDADWAHLAVLESGNLLQHRLRRDRTERGYNHVVRLSDLGWRTAAFARKERAAKDQHNQPELWGDE